MWDLIASVLDHGLSFNFTARKPERRAQAVQPFPNLQFSE